MVTVTAQMEPAIADKDGRVKIAPFPLALIIATTTVSAPTASATVALALPVKIVPSARAPQGARDTVFAPTTRVSVVTAGRASTAR